MAYKVGENVLNLDVSPNVVDLLSSDRYRSHLKFSLYLIVCQEVLEHIRHGSLT